MTREIKILTIKNRIKLLTSRPKENQRIVQKLKRQFKFLVGIEYGELV